MEARSMGLRTSFRPRSIPGCIRTMSIGEEPVSCFRTRFSVVRFALQNSRLLNHARKVRDRLFIDGRRLNIIRLPNFGHVTAGQDWQEARYHAPIEARTGRIGKSPYRLGA